METQKLQTQLQGQILCDCLRPPTTDAMALQDCRAIEHKDIKPRLTIPFTWKSFLYLCIKPTMKSSYQSWQNPPASQAAAAAPTSTLGICHTSLPPLFWFRNNNNNNYHIVCSPPPWVSKKGKIYVSIIKVFD